MTKQLKCDIILSSNLNAVSLSASFSYGSLILCYEGKELSNDDIKLFNKEKQSLENSIERRKKLLSNEKYVLNAPKKIVDAEKQKLKEEEDKLKTLLEKINL